MTGGTVRRRGAVALVSLGLVAALIADGLASPRSPASAATNQDEPELTWLAIGDSFTSGQGLPDATGSCYQSDSAYAPLTRNRLENSGWQIDTFAFTACHGHHSRHYYNPADRALGYTDDLSLAIMSQSELARELGVEDAGGVDILTMTFGGNDIGFASVIAGCMLSGYLPVPELPPIGETTDEVWGGDVRDPVVWGEDPSSAGEQACPVGRDELSARIASLQAPPGNLPAEVSHRLPVGAQGSLTDLYAALQDHYLSEHGVMVVIGYPRLFGDVDEWSQSRRKCAGILAEDARMLNGMAEELDTALRQAVDEARAQGRRIKYLSTLTRFEGHELCGTSHAYLNHRDLFTGQFAFWRAWFHPNAAGHDAIAELLHRELLSLARDDATREQPDDITPTPPEEPGEGPPLSGAAWVLQAGTGTGSVSPRSLAAVDDGGAVITGNFYGTVDFGDVTLTSAGEDDGFTFKVDDAGRLVWATHTGTGTGRVFPSSIAATSDGGAIVTGVFEGAARFGEVTLTSAGERDGFTFKVDDAGRLVWATHTGTGTDQVLVGPVAATADGGAIVAGRFVGTARFGEVTLASAGGTTDGVTFKVDGAGRVVWASRTGTANGSDFVSLGSVAATTDGGAIIAGQFWGSARFGNVTLTSAGGADGVTFKIDSAGRVAWVSRAGSGPDRVYAPSVTVTADGGAVVAGRFEGTARYGDLTLSSVGNADGVTFKLDSTGRVVWVTHLPATTTIHPQSVAATTDGGAVVTGGFTGTTHVGDVTLTSTEGGGIDAITFKVDSAGRVLWVAQSGQGGANSSSVDAGADGVVFLTGWFSGTARFGDVTLTSGGELDGFTLKLGPEGHLP